MDTERQVYLGTGAKFGFYTLHIVTMCNGYYHDRYVQNLSTNFNAAHAKAAKYADNANATITYDPFDLDDINGLRGAEKWAMLLSLLSPKFIPTIPFGKYQNELLTNELFSSDINYFWWMLDNLCACAVDVIPFRVFLACKLADSGTLSLSEQKTEKKKEDLKNAVLVPITDKRIKITGTVLSIKIVETVYGFTTKILLKSSTGYKVWGSLPKPLVGKVSVNTTIEFMARISVSDNDKYFGFFSRPTKAVIASK